MKNKGFTLIELMIVIAIVGILVAVVLPGYRNYVLEGQRTDTQGKMLQIVELQERFERDGHEGHQPAALLHGRRLQRPLDSSDGPLPGNGRGTGDR